ncbi:MAG: PDZ domain-containing protein [Actinobacteria bacterium]|nr:PDZ domain-containing protein [Actinomycetota bacterium]
METLLYLAGILFIVLGIAVSIGIHEIGHLLPAKLFGVKVTKYMIGFGPTLYSKKVGETEYGLKAFPLGGYIAMLGMYPAAKKPDTGTGFFKDMISQARSAHSESETAADAKRKFYQLPVAKRMIIMLGGPFMNLILGVLLTTVALSGFGVYQSSLKIEAVSVCLDNDSNTCSVAEQTPAHIAGLKAGDEVVSVGGKIATDWNQIRELLTNTPTAEFEVLRDGARITVSVTAVIQQRPQFDSLGSPILDEEGEVVYAPAPFLGVFLAPERKAIPLANSLEASGQSIAQIGQLILRLPQEVVEVTAVTFGGGERDANGPISIVGIGQVAGEVAASDDASLVDKVATGIQILGSLNFALFVFNMIPLLPLDGGHVAGGIYESIKRGLFRALGKKDPGPADTALLMPLTWFVFIALLAVSALLITADLVNPVSLFG